MEKDAYEILLSHIQLGGKELIFMKFGVNIIRGYPNFVFLIQFLTISNNSLQKLQRVV
jgi:hypothetical protein